MNFDYFDELTCTTFRGNLDCVFVPFQNLATV